MDEFFDTPSKCLITVFGVKEIEALTALLQGDTLDMFQLEQLEGKLTSLLTTRTAIVVDRLPEDVLDER
jgi:hypothetical protein